MKKNIANVSKKISIVTVVWGKDFSKKWLQSCFLAYFAPHNIPFLLKKKYEVELVICGDVESKSSILKFLKLNKFESIRLKFIDINHILKNSPNYGVTLTKSFYEAVNSYGEESLKRYFIFLNADFFISKDLFKGLEKRIVSGQEVVMGFSLRVQEEILDEIKNYIKHTPDYNIAVSEKEMINLFFKYQHPTVQGQIYGTHLFFSIQHQLYFAINKNEMICYHILRSPLMIKPTKITKNPTGYFDFNCVHDMCPTSEVAWLNNSNEGVILELESPTKEVICLREEQEIDFRRRFETFRNSLNSLHKANALQPIHLFSTKSSCKGLSKKYRIALEKYKEMILEITPFPFIDHYYWTMAQKDAEAKKLHVSTNKFVNFCQKLLKINFIRFFLSRIRKILGKMWFIKKILKKILPLKIQQFCIKCIKNV